MPPPPSDLLDPTGDIPDVAACRFGIFLRLGVGSFGTEERGRGNASGRAEIRGLPEGAAYVESHYGHPGEGGDETEVGEHGEKEAEGGRHHVHL